MNITDFQQIVRSNVVRLNNYKDDKIIEKAEKELPNCKIYSSNNYYIKDIILEPNEITGYFDMVNDICVIENYDEMFSDKIIYKIEIHHYIKFLDKGEIIIEDLNLSAKEVCRRQLQKTIFNKVDSAKENDTTFTMILSDLSYDNLIIPDFCAQSVYPVYKKFIEEKYKKIIPSIEKLKEEISDNKIIAEVLSDSSLIKNVHDFSPFNYEEVKNQLKDDMIYDNLKLDELEHKLYMINDWLRKIHYTYIAKRDVAICCKKFMISNEYKQ